MKNAIRNLAAALCLLAVMTAGGTLLSAQTAGKAIGVKPAKPDVPALQATANKAAASIEADDPALKAMVAAVKDKNTEGAKSLLLRHGFNAKQLDGMQIVLVDKTGPKEMKAKIKVTITISCCPLKGSITISW